MLAADPREAVIPVGAALAEAAFTWFALRWSGRVDFQRVLCARVQRWRNVLGNFGLSRVLGPRVRSGGVRQYRGVRGADDATFFGATADEP
jgi:hypothetical protein